MDYKELVDELNNYSAENQNHGGITAQAATATTDLLARARAAEGKLEDAEKAIDRRKKLFSEYQIQVRSNYKRLRDECKKWEGLYRTTLACAELAESRAKDAELEKEDAIADIERLMVRSVVAGDEPCDICANASETPCEVCEPKWKGRKK